MGFVYKLGIVFLHLISNIWTRIFLYRYEANYIILNTENQSKNLTLNLIFVKL